MAGARIAEQAMAYKVKQGRCRDRLMPNPWSEKEDKIRCDISAK
jgi:hypothetical protein